MSRRKAYERLSIWKHKLESIIYKQHCSNTFFFSSTAFALSALLSCGSQQELPLQMQQETKNKIQNLSQQQVFLNANSQMSVKALEEQKQSMDLSKLRFEQQLEEANQRLEKLNQKFSNLKPALPKEDKTAKALSPPSSVVDYLLLEERLGQLEANLRIATQLEAKEQEYEEEILRVRNKLRQVHSFWSQALALELKTEVLKNGVLLAQEAYELAYSNNWRLAKELSLYFFGFKWLWGAFTLYAPTTDTSVVSRQLNEAKEALKRFRSSTLLKRSELEIAYKNSLVEFTQALKLVLNKTSFSSKSRDLERLLVLLPQFFEEARELILRDALVSRKAHERGKIVEKIHKSRVAREEWELEGFTVGPSFLFNLLLTWASKTVGTAEVYEELKTRVSKEANNFDISKLGFKESDTALLVDLIVYLALENVAFYRALDLNSCEALLSWVDYEYLATSGSYASRYRDDVRKGCDQLTALLKAWSSGLDQILELHRAFRWRTEGSLGAQFHWDRKRLPDLLYERSENPFYVSSRNADVLSQRFADIFLNFFLSDPNLEALRSQEGEEAGQIEKDPGEKRSNQPPGSLVGSPINKPHLPTFVLKEEISAIENLRANTRPEIKQKAKWLISSPNFLANKIGEKKKEIEKTSKKLQSLKENFEASRKFYELLSKGEKEAQLAKTTYGVLLRREAELSESKDFVRLKEEELKHKAQTHWSMPKEIALYLFGFKWLWGAFTGYQPTANTSKVQKELVRLTSAHRSLELALTPKIKKLKEEFAKQKAQALELLNLAERAAPSFKEKETVLRFSQTFVSLFGEYELASQKFENAKAVFVQAQYNSWEHFSQGGKTVWGDYNLTGEVAQTLSEGLYEKEEFKEGEETLARPPLTTKERHEAAYEAAKRALAQAARSFNSFFEAKEAREVNRIFRRIEQNFLALEKLRLHQKHQLEELASLKLKLSQETHRA